MTVYIDGKYYEDEDAKISVFDHAVLYGDGVYDTIRVYKGKAFRFKDHLKRLEESAKKMSIYLPKNLRQIIKETYRKSGMKDAFIRIIITRGIGPMGVNPTYCKSSVIIMVVKRELSNKPVKTMLVHFSRDFADIKSLNYMASVMAKIEALKKGYNDAIMVTLHGFVTEATTENVFIVKNGKIYTPKLECGILDGVTRKVIMENFDVHEELMEIYDLLDADEIFLTGTADEIVPVININGNKKEIGPTTEKVMKKFNKLILEGELL